MVLPRLIEAKYMHDFTIWLRFADGSEGEVNLSDELEGEIFEPLQDSAYFQRLSLHPELKTVVWPNGADFAPEFLKSALKIAA